MNDRTLAIVVKLTQADPMLHIAVGLDLLLLVLLVL